MPKNRRNATLAEALAWPRGEKALVEAGAFKPGLKRKPRLKTSKPTPEDDLALQLKIAGLSFEREVVFAPPRKWRFDFVLLVVDRDGISLSYSSLAIEVDGGVHSGGRHVRGTGFVEDCVKYAEAMALGWRVLRCPSEWVKNGTAMKYIEKLRLL